MTLIKTGGIQTSAINVICLIITTPKNIRLIINPNAWPKPKPLIFNPNPKIRPSPKHNSNPNPKSNPNFKLNFNPTQSKPNCTLTKTQNLSLKHNSLSLMLNPNLKSYPQPNHNAKAKPKS